MYIRNLRKPSANKNVFKFASSKSTDAIMCESTIEFDACFHHEYNESVQSFESQPQGFHYYFNGKKLPYTPDTKIVHDSGAIVLHEYKPYSQTSEPIFREKFEAKKEAAKQLGMSLILVTDKQIRVEPLLNNLKILHRHSGVYGISEVQNWLLEIIPKNSEISLKDISEKHGFNLADARSMICSLIGKGLIKANLTSDDLSAEFNVRCA
jgi:hypothetical protein